MLYMDGKAQYTIQKGMGNMGELFTVEYAKRSRPLSMKTDHFHSEYEIYFLVSGSVEYFIDGGLYLLTAGSFALIAPGVLHRTLKGSGAHERILIMLDPQFLAAFLELEAGLFDCFDRLSVFTPPKPEGYVTLLNQLYREYRSGKPSDVLLRSYTAQLLVLLGREPAAVPYGAHTSDDVQTHRILEAVAYINDHYAEEIDRDLLCRRVFVSPSHFSRLFKQVTGFTYVEYLGTVRLKNAAHLLAQGGMNVTATAEACGFSSSNHFCKQFKAVMGISPLQYQKKHRNK